MCVSAQNHLLHRSSSFVNWLHCPVFPIININSGSVSCQHFISTHALPSEQNNITVQAQTKNELLF